MPLWQRSDEKLRRSRSWQALRAQAETSSERSARHEITATFGGKFGERGGRRHSAGPARDLAGTSPSADRLRLEDHYGGLRALPAHRQDAAGPRPVARGSQGADDGALPGL